MRRAWDALLVPDVPRGGTPSEKALPGSYAAAAAEHQTYGCHHLGARHRFSDGPTVELGGVTRAYFRPFHINFFQAPQLDRLRHARVTVPFVLTCHCEAGWV